jgi:hypothetical protein
VILIDSVAAMRKFNIAMFVLGVVFGLGWALLTDPLTARLCGTVSVLAGLFGGLGGFRIQALQQPRRLTAKQRRALLKVLTLLPTSPIAVRACASDPEAIDFSTDVIGTMKDAGWDARQALSVTHPTRAGLAVGVIGSDQAAMDRARQLIHALSAAGLDIRADPERIGGPSIELVAVLIGPKPDVFSAASSSQPPSDDIVGAAPPLRHFDIHALNMGRLVGNLLTLEMAARMAVARLDRQSGGTPAETLIHVRQGDWVRINPFTNLDDLQRTLEKYNKYAPLACRLELGPIVRLRDALAHGRMFGSGPIRPDASLKLIKFDTKPQNNHVQVSLVVDMTAEWFSENLATLSKGLEKVARAIDYERRDLSTLE